MAFSDFHLVLELVIMVLLSAFFSGAEVALFSVDKKKMTGQFVAGSILAFYLEKLLSSPRRLLVTILVGNTLVNTFASIITAIYSVKIAQSYGLNQDIVIVVQIFLLAVIILVFGEITPKVVSSVNPVLIAKIVAIPLYCINVVLYPVAELLTEIFRLLSKKINFSFFKHALTQEEMRFLATVGHEKGTIDQDEQGIINKVMETKTTVVREIMVHRTEITAVPFNCTFQEIIEIVLKTSHNRIPVYKEDLDDIVGVIYVKDLLKFVSDKNLQEAFSLHKIMRNPLIVPEAKPINELMREFQEKKMHIAIVVDEYGGTSGLVTLENIIQEVIGELHEEADKSEQLIQKIGESKYRVDGTSHIDDFSEYFDIRIHDSNKEFDTVAGWVLYHIGDLPKPGYAFRFENLRIVIQDSTKSKINFIIVEKL